MSALYRLPFTIVFLFLMIVANYAAGTFAGVLPATSLQKWGISHQDILGGGIYRLIAGTFLSHDFSMFLRQFWFAASVIGFYEWGQGTLRASGMFVVIDILGTLVVLFAVLGPLDGAPWGAFHGVRSLHDVGMSAGGFGLIGAIAATLRYKYVTLFAILASIAVKVMFDFDAIADTAHLVTLFIGFAAQIYLFENASNASNSL
ncbi:MAG: hypothetical protein ABJI96_21290 [Paracoccaceae bacterium]